MPFLNLEWTSNRIQFFGEVDLFSVLSGLLYRNEWSSISGILNYTREAEIAEKATNTGYHSAKLFSTTQHAKYCIIPSSSRRNFVIE